MKIFTIKENIFKTEPLFILDCSYFEMINYLKRKYHIIIENEDESTTCGRMFTFDKTPWRVVWTKNKTLPEIFHETFHLVTRICADKGIPIVAHFSSGEIGDETAAYLFEFFSRTILRKIRR